MMDPFEKFSSGAMDWTLAHRNFFVLPSRDCGECLQMLKPVGELALTGDVLVRHPNSPEGFRTHGASLLSHCWDQLKSGIILHELLLLYPDLLILAAVYSTFWSHGLTHKGFERRLAQLLRRRGVQALEYPPWRALELAVTFDALGLESPWSEEDTLRATWLASKPEPHTIGESSAYSLTHTVFYVTRFGHQPLRLNSDLRCYLRLWLPVWIRHYERAGNFDLMAEMVMTSRCIGEWDMDDAGAVLLRAQASDGMLPGPPIRGFGLIPTDVDPIRRRFLDNYHTTLVGLMAGVMSYSRPSA